MTVALTTPVTGSAQTGFTTPGYTIVADTSPNANSKQWAVTALVGTQTGVDTNTVSKPFTTTVFRPEVLKTLPQANVSTGIVTKVPINQWKWITRKGAAPAANQIPLTARITTIFEVPAGTDTFEPEDIRAMLSLHIGAMTQASAGLGDSLVSGVL